MSVANLTENNFMTQQLPWLKCIGLHQVTTMANSNLLDTVYLLTFLIGILINWLSNHPKIILKHNNSLKCSIPSSEPKHEFMVVNIKLL